MKRTVALLLLLSGCSSAPVADLYDRYSPARIEPGPYYGGIGGQADPGAGRPDSNQQPGKK